MTCFRVSRSSQDEQLPLAVGVKNNSIELLDSRGKTWSIANFVICEDGVSSPARSREELYEEYLECFRDRINLFNITTVADDKKPSWVHFVELIWLHSACQTVRQYRPELNPMFDSRENKDYPRFNPETDSVDATRMFRPRTLAVGEQAFLTAKYSWTVLIAPAEDINSMSGFCPAFPLRVVASRPQQFQGLPMNHDASINRRSIELSAQQQAQLYTTSPTYSIPDLSRTNNFHSSPGNNQHTKTTSIDSKDLGMQRRRRISGNQGSSSRVVVDSNHHGVSANMPTAPMSLIPEHLNCAVQLKFNQGAKNNEVFATIHTGAIYSYTRALVERGTSIAELVFMTRDGAQNYIETIRNENIVLHRKPLTAIWSDNRVGPCNLQGVSRVLKLTGPVSGYGLNRFNRYAKQCCWVDIINQQERVVGTEREVVVEFGSYAGQAEVVHAAVLSNAAMSKHKIEFMRDPCDVPEGN